MINTQIGVLFGHGSVVVGCNETKSGDWYVVIRPSTAKFNPGDTVKDEVNFDNEIMLVFPTEKQMLTVMAAFTNKSFEEVENKWIEKLAEKIKNLELTSNN